MCRKLSPQTRNTGCGTQPLLRIRLHLAGRGPNNSSLFPPLAAVTVVASHSIARPIALRATGSHPSGRSSEKLPARRPGKLGPHPQVIRRRNSLPSCPAHRPFYHNRIYLQIVQKLHKEMPRLSGSIRVQSGRCKDTSQKPTRAFLCGGRCFGHDPAGPY